MHDRIRAIREEKKMSRASFGEKLGVSGDVINNLERGRVDVKEHIIKLICAEYSVNEEWLRSGKGSMFIEPETFSLDEFMKEHAATELELQIVKACFELEPDTRKMLIEHFRNRISADTTSQDNTKEPEPTVEELEAEYKKSVLKGVQKKGSSVLNTTEDIESKNA